MRDCPHCYERIADKRDVCPHCNNKVEPKKISEVDSYLNPYKTLDTIFFATAIEAYGLGFDDDGKFIIKNSNQLAEGQYKSFFHKFGLIKSKDVSTIGEFENGEIIKLTEYDKYGNIINCWKRWNGKLYNAIEVNEWDDK